MKITFQSSTYFNNIKTAIVKLIILPIFEILLLVLMLQVYSGKLSTELTTASLIMSGVTIAMSMITGLFIGDINKGIDRYVVIQEKFSMYYWITKVSVTFICAMLVVFINTLLLMWFNIVNIYFVVILSPIAILFGIVIGLCTSFLSWRQSNPYFASNIVRALIPILSGAILSYESYPYIFKELTYMFPFARLLNLVHHGKLDIYIDILIFIIWVLVMIIIYKVQKRYLAMNKRHSGI